MCIKSRKNITFYTKPQFTKGLFTTPLESEYIDSITWKEVIEAVKNNNKYIVCNQDEPYAEEVWQTILKGEDAKTLQSLEGR